jgi:hypothetical protein
MNGRRRCRQTLNWRAIGLTLVFTGVAAAAGLGWLHRYNTTRELAAEKVSLERQIQRVEMDICRNREVLARLQSPGSLRKSVAALKLDLSAIQPAQLVAMYDLPPRVRPGTPGLVKVTSAK